MSARNGDKSRYQINRKRAIHRRVKIRQLVKSVRGGPVASRPRKDRVAERTGVSGVRPRCPEPVDCGKESRARCLSVSGRACRLRAGLGAVIAADGGSGAQVSRRGESGAVAPD